MVGSLDADVGSVLEGLDGFIRSEVLPLEEKYASDLADPRRVYDESGKHADWYEEICQEIREKSAEAGYYTLFAPEEVGGAGGGYLLQYTVWEHLYHKYGP